MCTQGECIWLHAELIKDVLEMCKDIFQGGSVQYGYTTIPTYPSGQIGFVMCCKPDEEGKTAEFVAPAREPPEAPGASPFSLGITRSRSTFRVPSCRFSSFSGLPFVSKRPNARSPRVRCELK